MTSPTTAAAPSGTYGRSCSLPLSVQFRRKSMAAQLRRDRVCERSYFNAQRQYQQGLADAYEAAAKLTENAENQALTRERQ